MQNPTTFAPGAQLKLVGNERINWQAIREVKKNRAQAQNKIRYQSLFAIAGPSLLPRIAPQTISEPNYMGYPLSEFEDEAPCYDYEQFGGGWQ
jgi:hypothetical protein